MTIYFCDFILQAEELSFDEDDLLYLYDRDTNPDWWRAKCGDKKGLIPVAYGAKDCLKTFFIPLYI